MTKEFKTIKGQAQDYINNVLDWLTQDNEGHYTKDVTYDDLDEEINIDYKNGLELSSECCIESILSDRENILKTLTDKYKGMGYLEGFATKENLELAIRKCYELAIVDEFENLKSVCKEDDLKEFCFDCETKSIEFDTVNLDKLFNNALDKFIEENKNKEMDYIDIEEEIINNFTEEMEKYSPEQCIIAFYSNDYFAPEHNYDEDNFSIEALLEEPLNTISYISMPGIDLILGEDIVELDDKMMKTLRDGIEKNSVFTIEQTLDDKLKSADERVDKSIKDTDNREHVWLCHE